LLEAAAAALRESPLPPDLLEAFVQSLHEYRGARARTLDEAFNVERQKGWRQQAAMDKSKKHHIRLAVERYRDEGAPIDEAIRMVAEEVGFCKTKTEELYYEHARAWPKWVLPMMSPITTGQLAVPIKTENKREDP